MVFNRSSIIVRRLTHRCGDEFNANAIIEASKSSQFQLRNTLPVYGEGICKTGTEFRSSLRASFVSHTHTHIHTRAQITVTDRSSSRGRHDIGLPVDTSGQIPGARTYRCWKNQAIESNTGSIIRPAPDPLSAISDGAVDPGVVDDSARPISLFVP